MNSDNIVNFAENLVAPIENNKYLRALLLVVLIVSTGYFVPHPIVPSGVYKVIRDYKILGFILTLLLAYLLTRDMNVSLVATLLIFVLHFVTKKLESFESVDYVNMYVNEYNYDLDRVIQKKKAPMQKIGFARPQQVENARETGPSVPEVENVSRSQSREAPSKVPSERVFRAACKNVDTDDFKFNKDNLRYLNYNPQKMHNFEEAVYDDKLTGNNTMPIDEYE